MFKALFSKKFLLQIVLSAIVVLMALAGAYYYLLAFTRQDKIVEVPELEGYDVVEAEALLKELTLEGVVVDSLYLPGTRGGLIVDQEPLPQSKVKENRKIYITIARYSSPMVKLPNVIDQTLPLVLAKLSSYGIEVGDITYKPSECTHCVIGAQVQGKAIKPGHPLSKGQKIDLVVGEGATGEKIAVPALYGLSVEEAQQILNHEGLNLGATPYLDCETAEDSLAARIFKQVPEPVAQNRISRGASIDVYLTSDLTQIPPANLDSIKALIRP